MKALFIYSRLTGKSRFISSLNWIEKEFRNKFDELRIVETKTSEEFHKECLLACKEYDYLIFIGGDGAVNSVINFIANEPRKPILGYIPGGTTNDFAKNMRLRKNIKSAVKNIINGVPAPFDICKVNDKYFAYVLACGIYSEISYSAKRNIKKKIGSLSYYIMAIRDAFTPHKVKGTLKCNGQIYSVDTPFLLVLNGNHVGGFYVNIKNKINDGKFTIFITKPGVFNGLLHYLFFKVKTQKIKTSKFTFSFFGLEEPWCLDGERADLKNIEVTCLHSYLKMIVPKRIAKKLNKQALEEIIN